MAEHGGGHSSGGHSSGGGDAFGSIGLVPIAFAALSLVSVFGCIYWIVKAKNRFLALAYVLTLIPLLYYETTWAGEAFHNWKANDFWTVILKLFVWFFQTFFMLINLVFGFVYEWVIQPYGKTYFLLPALCLLIGMIVAMYNRKHKANAAPSHH